MRRPAPSSCASACAPCSTPASSSCSTASSTPLWPTRAADAGSGIDEVRAINTFATGSLWPDRTLLLRIAPAEGRARLRERASEPDRLELEDGPFFERIATAYDELARDDPARIHVLDASLGPTRVLADALGAIEDLL